MGKGDFSRFTHKPEKHYTRVLQQQGRVFLDSEWNEYGEIQEHLDRTKGIDVIGPCGTPRDIGGFKVNAELLEGADVFFIDSATGWIVGDNGVVLATLDGGLNWESLYTGFTKNLNSLHFYDTLKGWAVGAEGIILATQNGGQDWVSQSSGVNKDLNGIHFRDDLHGWAVGDEGTILITDDGGQNWKAPINPPGVSANLNSVHVLSNQLVIIVGNSGTIIRFTTDGEDTWQVMNPVTENLKAIHFADAINGWAVGDAGTIRITTDGGETWNPPVNPAGTAEILFGVHCFGDSKAWIVGANGTILFTDDGGANWKTPDPPLGITDDWSGVYFINEPNGWIVGRAGAILKAEESEGEPNCTIITPSPPADLTISPGRIYVDGLMCVLETQSSYLHQPDYFDPPSLSFPTDLQGDDVRIDLIYLDVWQRHITAIEDPDIREVALGGPDTTTRIKTLWQVKLMQDVDIPRCHEDIADWPPAPSGGRLSTKLETEPEEEDHCQIAPEGGYTGLENRLYRVEIHDGGELGEATFKWSRDNGSVVFEIQEFLSGQQDKVRLKSLGRDQVLTLKKNDWIEILDDTYELSDNPVGTLAQITDDPDKAERIITLSQDLSGFDMNRHPKLRRWDQNADKITVTDAEEGILLENGVKVVFSGGNFKPGDYWVFAARTCTANVEELIDAPPRGIEHHYCKLGLMKYSISGFDIIDCRRKFSRLQESCCTKVVFPGEDIQGAINTLPEDGGCICLKTGTHTIKEPITIDRPNVTLHAESSETKVERNNGMNLLTIDGNSYTGSSKVAIEGIEFVAKEYIDDGGISALILVDECDKVTIKNCVARVHSDTTEPVLAVYGIYLHGSTQITLFGNRISRILCGIIAERGAAPIPGMTKSLDFSDNIITDRITDGGVVEPHGIFIKDDVLQACLIRNNVVDTFRNGIVVCRLADHSIVEKNMVLRPSEDLTETTYGIDVAADCCVVKENYLNLTEYAHGGILVTGVHSVVEKNTVKSEADPPTPPDTIPEMIPIGIYLGRELAGSEMLPDHGVIRCNVLSGFQDAIRVSGPEIGVMDVQVLENHIEGVYLLAATGDFRSDPPQFSAAIRLSYVGDALVSGNQIGVSELGIYMYKGNRSLITQNNLSPVVNPSDEEISSISGITVVDSDSITISENRVEKMQEYGIQVTVMGIDSEVPSNIAVLHNFVDTRGFRPPNGAESWDVHGIGISTVKNVAVESCEIHHTGIGEYVQSFGIRIADAEGDIRVCSNKVAGTVDEPALRKALELNCKADSMAQNLAQVIGNSFVGGAKDGGTRLVSIKLDSGAASTAIIFSDNRCKHYTWVVDFPYPTDLATVHLNSTAALIVMGNHVWADWEDCTPFILDADMLTAMGNITMSDWDDTNVTSKKPTDLGSLNFC